MVDRGRRQVARGALGEHGEARGDVGARLEVAERLAVPAATLVARAHADDATVVEQQLVAGRLGQDHRAAGLRLLAEEAAELGDRDDPVAVVHHRRRRRDAERRALREQVDGLAVHLPVGRHLLDRHPPREELADRARVHHRAREEVRPGLLALLEHGDGDVAELLLHLRVLLEELAEPDRAGEATGPAADDQDAHVDALVDRIGRRRDRVGGREGRRMVGGADAAHVT